MLCALQAVAGLGPRRPRRACNRCSSRQATARKLTRELDPRALQDEADVLSLRLARPGVALPGDLGRPEPRHGLHGIARGVRAELGPALAPEVLGHLGSVDHLEHLGHFSGARRDFAVVLADPEYVVSGALTFLGSALDLARLPHRDTDLRHDQPERSRGAGHRGHDWIGPAV